MMNPFKFNRDKLTIPDTVPEDKPEVLLQAIKNNEAKSFVELQQITGFSEILLAVLLTDLFKAGKITKNKLDRTRYYSAEQNARNEALEEARKASGRPREQYGALRDKILTALKTH